MNDGYTYTTIPAPEARGRQLYPWDTLPIGSGFLIVPRPREPEARAANRVRSAAKQYADRHPGVQFIVARANTPTDRRYYCWRIR